MSGDRHDSTVPVGSVQPVQDTKSLAGPARGSLRPNPDRPGLTGRPGCARGDYVVTFSQPRADDLFR